MHRDRPGRVTTLALRFEFGFKTKSYYVVSSFRVSLQRPILVSLSQNLKKKLVNNVSCVWVYIYIYIHEVHTISFQTFFVWALLLIVYTWNSSPLRSNLLRLQCTCCTIQTTSGTSHGSPLVGGCQWPSSQSLLSPQLSHNDNLWA